MQEGIQRLRDALDIRYTQLYEGRRDTLDVHWKAWFESGAFKGSMKWLTWSGFYHCRYSLQPQEYIDLLSLRLLESPFRRSLTGQIPKCRCEYEVDLSTLPLHALQCGGACYLDNPRHNDLRDIVYTFAQSCHPETQPKKEQAIIHPVAATRYEGASCSTSTVCILSMSLLSTRLQRVLRGPASYNQASQGEESTLVDQGTVVEVHPFILETTGRLGKEALKYLEEYRGHKIRAQTLLLCSIAGALARRNAQRITAIRKKLAQ